MAMLVLAHRGARQLAVENTLESLEIALADGADGVEFDVQRTGDGELILFHDADLARLTGHPRAVTAIAWRVLREMPLHDRGFTAPRVTHLDEALNLFARYPKAWINVEIKVDDGSANGLQLAQALAKRLHGVPTRRWVFSSFDRAALQRLQDLAPTWPRGALVESASVGDFKHLACGSTESLALSTVHPAFDLVDAAQLAQWRAQGWRVWPWTVNGPQAWQKAVEMGVDAVITDDPQGLQAFCMRHGVARGAAELSK